MKMSAQFALAAVTFGALTIAPLATVLAQGTVTTTTATNRDGTSVAQTTTSEGTIQEFTPGTSRIIVKSSAGPATYTYSKKTTFVDSAGNVISYESIKTGEPTTVYYTMEAGQPVVTKVVVNRTATPAIPVTRTVEETTTTTTTRH